MFFPVFLVKNFHQNKKENTYEGRNNTGYNVVTLFRTGSENSYAKISNHLKTVIMIEQKINIYPSDLL